MDRASEHVQGIEGIRLGNYVAPRDIKLQMMNKVEGRQRHGIDKPLVTRQALGFDENRKNEFSNSHQQVTQRLQEQFKAMEANKIKVQQKFKELSKKQEQPQKKPLQDFSGLIEEEKAGEQDVNSNQSYNNMRVSSLQSDKEESNVSKEYKRDI